MGVRGCAENLQSVVPYLGIICGVALTVTGVLGLLDFIDIPAFIKVPANNQELSVGIFHSPPASARVSTALCSAFW